MAEVLTPTLEDLRDIPEAAWLWDSARARIVWANRAGIAYFGGQSLFDLIDRPFDFLEPGVERIAELGRKLRRGQVENCLLHFPSSGATAPLACKCMVHALPDGRPGVLAAAIRSAADADKVETAEIASAFDLLPSAAILIGRDGAFRHLNAAALLLLGGTQRASLSGFLGADASDQLLSRLAQAGTVSEIQTLGVRLGQRDLRLTARRFQVSGDDGAYGLLLLDDVTERRALERQMTGTASDDVPSSEPVTPTPDSEAEAFKKLGEVLKQETADVPPPRPAAKPPAAPRRPLPHIPDPVRIPLDRMADAVLIAKDGKLLYANPAACALLGHDSAEDAINDIALLGRFGPLGQSLPVTDVDLDGGRSITVSVQMGIIPWLGGPARQFILRKSDQRSLQLVPPSPQPEPPPPKAEAVAPETIEPPPPLPTADVIPMPVRVPASAPVAEADDELRAILDTATDGIITLDSHALIHSFSAGAEAIFGYRIAEVAGKPFTDLIAADSRKTVRDYLAALQGPGLASVFNDGREVSAEVKQGGTVPLFLTVGKIATPKSPAAFCAVVRDITQWKKTESELREAKERAEETSRQKSEFLARISHELRTPLNAIMGFSEVMRLERFGEIENEKYRGYVNDIHSSGSHLLSLINDLLDLSKVEAGKLELNFTSVSLSDVADHAMKMLQEAATAARVVLRKAMPADLPNVVADLRSMRQIMLNLLSNALKFTDPGGQVIVSAQVTAGGELKLRVKDTGIGMNAEQLQDALEPFRRVTTDGRDAPGSGLGLPLTKALAEANRTQFAISSEPRKGTLVEITFPTTRVLAS
ncbi:PAS domain S-box protein [Aestuariivirga sp.]|uniref:PAS domain S-box protein n=1 Tax=Aestuariivirga sp. TaxID=2650926 RepID=UPI0039E43887